MIYCHALSTFGLYLRRCRARYTTTLANNNYLTCSFNCCTQTKNFHKNVCLLYNHCHFHPAEMRFRVPNN